MNNNTLISKKELLQMTGISYGQLYRWKRENLIPEHWFIKKSSFTGQETFFVKDKILKRVKEILDLKDKYSLEELSKLISPEFTKRIFDSNELRRIPQLKDKIINIFKNILHKNYFTYFEIIFIYAFSKYKDYLNDAGEDLKDIIKTVEHWSKIIKGTSFRFVILGKKTERLYLLIHQNTELIYDNSTQELKVIDLEEMLKELSLLMNNIIND